MQNIAYPRGKFNFIGAVIQLSLIIFCGIMFFSQTIFAADISIDKTYLMAGDTLIVNNSDGYSLKYYVDGTEQACTSLTLSTDYYEKWIKVEAYDSDNKLVSEDSAYFSKLPVLYIDTADGNAVTSKWAYRDATLAIQDNEQINDVMYKGSMQIKCRGNTSLNWPKKPYKIKLDSKADLFGMGKNKHWVLLANYLDESLLRNTTGFQISKALGLTAMDTVWTDVVFNGEYVGNYQLCEHIRIGSNRVDIYDWEDEAENVASAVYKAEKKKNNILDKDALEEALTEDLSWITSGTFTFNGTTYTVADYYTKLSSDISGGYLFELSEEYDENSKFTTNGGLKVMLNKPEYLSTNSDMMDYVQNYWNNFEAAYKSEDGYVQIDGKDYHYTELADLDSMISYWLTMEIVGNFDAEKKSRYAYKGTGELLKFGPVWDFDWGCGSIMVDSSGKNWQISKSYNGGNFYKEFLDDPLFLSKATEKYWQIRPYLEDMFKDGGVLDDEIDYLYESGIADHAAWDRTATFYGARGFEGDTAAFKTYMQTRLKWLDEQFATDKTLLESTYFSNSAYPYTKSDVIGITISNGIANTAEGNALAESLIATDSNVDVRLTSTDSNTVSANVYVNGIYAGNAVFTDGVADIELSNALFTYDVDEKNVISVIGKNSSDSTTYKNFTSVAKTNDCHSYTAGGICTICNGLENGRDGFKSASVTLNDGITINYKLLLSEEALNDKNAYIKFTSEQGVNTQLALSSGTALGDGLYEFNLDLLPNQMADSIVANVVYSDETEGNSVQYSVKKYMENIKAVGNTKLTALADATLNYGAAMQNYTSYNTDSLANANVSTVYDDNVSISDSYKMSLTGNVDGVKITGAALIADSLTTIRVKYSLDDDYSINDFTFTVDGKQYTTTKADNCYYLDITGITPDMLSHTYSISVSDKDGNTKTLNYSVLTYVKSVTENGNYPESLTAVAKALYYYNKAAVDYIS